MRNRKYKNKRTIKYFVITLMSTLLIGAFVLIIYARYFRENTSALAENSENGGTHTEPEEWLPEIPTDLEMDIQTGAQAEEQTEAQAEEQTEAQAEKTAEQPAEGVALAFGGDICFYDEYTNMYTLSNRGGKIDSCISDELLKEMQQADICMVNNEFPYSDRGIPIPEKTFTFRSKPENVKLLHEMGVDVVSLANNHAYDYGEDALLDTFSVLEEAGVGYVGAGRNLEEASKGMIYEVNGISIGILSATQIERVDNPDTKGATENTPGVLRCFTEQELNYFLETVTEVKKRCDVLIVYIHWGTENTDELDWAQPYQADLISKAGADLIVGAHPHCLQGVDVVNGVPVIYSLGNYWFNSKPLDTALLKVVVDRDGVETLQLLPARQQDCTTVMLKDSEKQRVLNYLQSLSQNVVISRDGLVTW